jgi:hypothetical protein
VRHGGMARGPRRSGQYNGHRYLEDLEGTYGFWYQSLKNQPQTYHMYSSLALGCAGPGLLILLHRVHGVNNTSYPMSLDFRLSTR